MGPGTEYISLETDESRKRGSLEEFLLRCLLGAREEASLPSNEGGFDEDVNVYLVGLLTAILGAEFHQRTQRYHYPSDLDLSRDVAKAHDDRFSYRVYRTNADHLLLSIGLFHHVEGTGSASRPAFQRSPRDFVGRGETYYQLASSSLRRLRKAPTGVEDILLKLAHRFEDYARVLTQLRGSYFHLTTRLGDGQLFHLLHDPLESEGSLTEARDAFLDAYSEYRESPDTDTRARLQEAAARLKEADPDFAFHMPEADEAP